MNINVSKLSAPIAFKTGNANSIARLDGDKMTANGTFSSRNIFRWMRTVETKNANNQVRTAFLRSLGEAFGIDGAVTGKDGKTHFSKGFMDHLEKLLGADFKRSDFGLDKNGVVSSGKPLTERRISAIVTRAMVIGKTPFDVDAYRAKVGEMAKMGAKAGLDAENLGKLRTQIARMNLALDFLAAGGVDAFIEENPAYDDEDDVSERSGYHVFGNDSHSDVPYFLKKEGEGRVPLKSKNALAEAIFMKYSDAANGGLLLHFENIKVTPDNHAFYGSEKRANFHDAVKSYVHDALQTYIKLAVDMFYDTIATPLFPTLVSDTFSSTACIEGQTSELIMFQANHGLVEQDDVGGSAEAGGAATVNLAVADHGENTDLFECLSREAQTLENTNHDKGKELGWDDYRPVFVKNLVGHVRPVQITAEGPVEVREVTEADIDALRTRLNDVLFFDE